MDKKLFQDWLLGVADVYHFSVDHRSPSSSDEIIDDSQLAVRELRTNPHTCADCQRECAGAPVRVHRRVECSEGTFWATRCVGCSRYRDFETGKYSIPAKVTQAALIFYWKKARKNK